MKRDRKVFVSKLMIETGNPNNNLPFYIRALTFTGDRPTYSSSASSLTTRADFLAKSCDGHYVICGNNSLYGAVAHNPVIYRCLPVETTPISVVKRIFRQVVRQEIKSYLESMAISKSNLEDHSSKTSVGHLADLEPTRKAPRS